MTNLMQRMRDGVPDAPDLDGLAGRAETVARRRRARRRGVAMASVAAVTATALVLPRVLMDDPGDAPPAAESDKQLAVSGCRATDAVDHDDFTEGTATYVRFCGFPSGNSQRGAALVPMSPLVNGAADLVASWQSEVQDRPEMVGCPAHLWSTDFRIQVGFDDGTVEEITGDTSGCLAYAHRGDIGVWSGASVWTGLMTSLAAQVRGPTEPLARPGLECPTKLADVEGRADASFPREVFATEGLVCEYELGTLGASGPLSAAKAEEVRLAALSQWRPIKVLVDCGKAAGPTLVTYLRTRVGDHVMWIEQGGCQTSYALGPEPRGYLGEPSPDLVRELNRALVVDY